MAVLLRNVSTWATSCSQGIAVSVAVPVSGPMGIMACWSFAVNDPPDAALTCRVNPLRAAALCKPWTTTNSAGTNELVPQKIASFEINALPVMVADVGVAGGTVLLLYP